MPRTVLFFDPYPDGHRLPTVLAYIEQLRRFPQLRVVFAVHEWVADMAAGRLGGRAPGNVSFERLPAAEAKTKRDPIGALRGVFLAERLARRHGADEVYFMCLDNFLTGVALRLLARPPFPVSGLVYKTTPYAAEEGEKDGSHALAKRRFRSALLRGVLRSRHVGLVHSVDPNPQEDARDREFAPRLVKAPDGVSPPAAAIAPPETPPGWLERKARFLVFGALSRRKGLLELVEALRALDDETLGEVGVLVCGVITDDVTPEFEASVRSLQRDRPAALVERLDRFISDEELWWLLERSTAVVAPYQRHVGSSGVLRWAAAADRPVLIQDVGVTGHETRKWKLGVSVDTTDPAKIAEGLRRLARGDPEALGEAAARRAFAAAHTEEAFASAVIGSLARSRPDPHRAAAAGPAEGLPRQRAGH